VQFGISFFNEGHPELLGIRTVTVKGRLRGNIVGDASIHSHELPSTVLEELEHSEARLEAIVHNQVLEQFGVHAHRGEGSQKPIICKDARLDVARHVVIFHQVGVIISVDLVRTSPLDDGDILSVLWGVQWVNVKRLVIGVEVNIAPLLIGFLHLAFNAVNFLKDGVVAGCSVHLVVLVNITLHFLTILVLAILIVLLVVELTFAIVLAVLVVIVILLVLLLVVLITVLLHWLLLLLIVIMKLLMLLVLLGALIVLLLLSTRLFLLLLGGVFLLLLFFAIRGRLLLLGGLLLLLHLLLSFLAVV